MKDFNFNQWLKSLQSFDWRVLQKYTSAQASEDLNDFLEKMPGNVGQTMLMATVIAWCVAGGTVLYTTVKMQELTELRAKLEESQAVKPVVPTVENSPVAASQVKEFSEKVVDIYDQLSIKASNSSILITAKSTHVFGQFREAIGHVQNGGSGWRVNVESLCVGRECTKEPLMAKLKINKISVDTPR